MQSLASRTLINGAQLSIKSNNPLRKVSVTRIARVANKTTTRMALAANVDSQVEKASFGVSAALDAAIAAAGLLDPAGFFNTLGVSSTASALNFHYGVAVVAILAATAAARCLSAVQRGRLESDTYQRLTLSLALQNAAVLPLMYFYGPALSGLAAPMKTLLTVKAVLGASQVAIWLSKSSRPAVVLKDAFSGIGDVLTVPSNPLSALYSVLAVVAGGAGVYYLTGPAAAAAWIDNFLPKLFGVHALAAAGFIYTLKNGADRGALGRGTFKQLNEATAVGAAVLAGLFYKSIKAGTIAASNTTNGILAILAVTAVTCAYQGVNAVIKKGSGGSVAAAISDDRGNYKYETKDPMEEYCANNPDADECRVYQD